MNRTLIHSALLVLEQGVEEGWVLFHGARIADTGRGSPPPGAMAPDAEVDVVDAAGRLVTPGFIDLHCHGGGGSAFADGAEGIRRALAAHRAHGTTRSVLSLSTAPLADLEYQVDVVAQVTATDTLVLGSHLEGPFLAPGHRGAHDPSLLRTPEAPSVARLIEAGRGTIRQVTMAPELPGAAAATRQLLEHGIAVAVGHTDADYDTAAAAFAGGASLLTHTFNGMSGIHHRSPGPVMAALRASHVVLEIINDGVHVHPEVVRLVFDAAPGRVALVTDAMAGAGAGDGSYDLGGRRVVVRRGVASLEDGTSLAGSTLTLDAALRNAVLHAGLPVETAVAALTVVPARAIGRSHDLGRLAPGYAADAVMLDDELAVVAVWADGVRLPSRSGHPAHGGDAS